ncbi:MAG TPA: cellulase family glycosylhydrolase, partial [Sunxiuqinia sp.]|nr:cellulase family glycosylhydrolase [Sunxiuqinia sp.]
VNKKQAAIWKQIAIYFRDYDEHLLFAGANEPNADTQEKVNVLNVYLQTFVDVVRSTGGHNAYRNLIIQAPNTDIDLADQYMTLPTDPTENRLLAEVHYYSPWNFCGMTEDADWGKMFYFWGTGYHVDGAGDRNANWGEEDYVRGQFQKMKTKFVDQSVPVILGEFGAVHRTLGDADWQKAHDKSRAYFFEYVVQEAKNYGLVPFVWDANNDVIDRQANAVGDQKAYDGLKKGAEDGGYPF